MCLARFLYCMADSSRSVRLAVRARPTRTASSEYHRVQNSWTLGPRNRQPAEHRQPDSLRLRPAAAQTREKAARVGRSGIWKLSSTQLHQRPLDANQPIPMPKRPTAKPWRFRPDMMFPKRSLELSPKLPDFSDAEHRRPTDPSVRILLMGASLSRAAR